MKLDTSFSRSLISTLCVQNVARASVLTVLAFMGATGCQTTPPTESNPESTSLSSVSPHRNLSRPSLPMAESLSKKWLDQPCVLGTWITDPGSCKCDLQEDKGEPVCESDDCQEADVLILAPNGYAGRTTIRWSTEEGLLTAPYEPELGKWKWYPGGELRLQFDSQVAYFPTTCIDSAIGSLQIKGQEPMTHPEPALGDSIWMAWTTGDWENVSYQP
ncbi:MAG: hypothetical protein IPK82_44545 [Polyangiaceae bacterium]|nr:hypothetical protein [Polyangiaceae bacterium]